MSFIKTPMTEKKTKRKMCNKRASTDEKVMYKLKFSDEKVRFSALKSQIIEHESEEERPCILPV